MEILCPKCAAPQREGAKFCRKCGARLDAEVEKHFCDECGAELAPGSDFCDMCGTRATGETAPTADTWDDALASLTAAEEEAKLAPFEYEKRPDGSVVITGLKDKYALSVTVPVGVTVIGEEAFRDTGILEVVLPEGLTSIENDAFNCCTNLTKVNLPASLLKIGGWAFNGCSELEIEIPSSVRIVGEYAVHGTKTETREKEEAKEKAEAERRAKEKAEAEARAKEEAERRAKEEAEAEARAKEEAERRAKKKAEAERRAKEKAEAEARAKEEAKERAKGTSGNPMVWELNLKFAGNPYDRTDPREYGFASQKAMTWLSGVIKTEDGKPYMCRNSKYEYSDRFVMASIAYAKGLCLGSFDGYFNKESGLKTIEWCMEYCTTKRCDPKFADGLLYLFKLLENDSF